MPRPAPRFAIPAGAALDRPSMSCPAGGDFLDLATRVGQLFVVGFEGTAPTGELDRFVRDLRPGGLVLFSRNVADGAQLRALNGALARATSPPPLLAVDQEGGRVDRLRAILPPMPPAAALASWSEERIRLYAAALGGVLSAAGFNTDFAPVLDLSRADAENGIGDRSFGEDAALVARCGGAFAAGLGDAGIAPFLKHFPGLGATEVDSHIEMPVCTREGAALWERDLLPFRACARQAAGIMIGHAHYPAFDPDRAVPASASEAIVTGLLRRRMDFVGIALTDDLGMGAVAGPSAGDIALRCLRAGNDMVMFCNRPDDARAAYETVLAAAVDGRIPEDLVDRAVGRILSAKARFGITGLGGPRAGETSQRPELRAAILKLQPFAGA